MLDCLLHLRISAVMFFFPMMPLFTSISSPINWPIRRMSNVSGDIMLGALFPVHERNAKFECGRLQDEGIHQLEALLLTINKINNDPSILPGIKLGVIALDSCDSATFALEQTLDFIKGFIARNDINVDRQFQCEDGTIPSYRNGSFDRVVGIIGGQSSSVSIQLANLLRLFRVPQAINKINNDPSILPGIKLGVIALDSCDLATFALEQTLDFIKGFVARNDINVDRQFRCEDGTIPSYRNGSFDRVVGIIGGQSSSVTIQLANLLRLFRVPQVSYQSTSPTLSNKEKYDYFFRTVPSDVNQAHAILEILRKFHWTYVSVVYSDTDYGNKGYEKLLELAPPEICFSSPQSINVDYFSEYDYDIVITNLMHKTHARVVVVFSDKQVARKVMAAAKRRKAINRFVWIGSEAWGGRKYVVEGHEKVVEGAITVSPLLRPLAGFDEHFQKLTPENNAENNPWFPEFWEEYFHCRLQGFDSTPYNQNYPKWCGEQQNRILPSNGYKQTPALHFVRDAAYAFAHALSEMHKIKCGGRPGLCDRMKTIDGAELKVFMEKVSFKDEGGKNFRFLPSGDAPPRYSIINFQKIQDTDEYEWRPVGTYAFNDVKGVNDLDLDVNAMRFKHDHTAFPMSFCSAPCLPGQAKLQLEGDTCCWLCTNCSTFQYLPDEFHCRDCPLGTLPSATKTTCVPIPEEYLSYSSPWAIGTMGLAGMGMLTTSIVGIVFWAYGDTPIIKASGRELSYLLLFGIFLSFSMTFVIVAKPAPCTCGITRFFLGFCYTLCYAAIVTKTNRIARIFNQRRQKPCQKPKYTSPKSQLVITALLVSVEVVINTTWLMYDRPAVTHMYPTREENVLICLGSDTASYLVGLIYPFVLIGFCTVYAFKTRKCPDGFNEARYLTFTNYTTCVIWLAFLPLFVLSTSNTIRAMTLSSLLSLSGAVQLACLFVPKVHIALFKPEKNTKEMVMCHHNRNASCLTLPAACQGMPAILLNGGCKDSYRNSTCSSASPSSVRNTNIQASPAAKHSSDLELCYKQPPPESRKYLAKNACQSISVAPSTSTANCGHQNFPIVDQHMTL